MSENTDYEQNRSDITSIIKDGMIKPIEVTGADGLPKLDYVIDSKSAYWKTHNINSDRFGLLAEAVEYLDVIGDDAKYNMSAPRALVLKTQISALVNNVLKKAIDAKSSETMRDKRSAQTSMVDKYLKRSQERIIDLKGDAKKSLLSGILGRESEKAEE